MHVCFLFDWEVVPVGPSTSASAAPAPQPRQPRPTQRLNLVGSAGRPSVPHRPRAASCTSISSQSLSHGGALAATPGTVPNSELAVPVAAEPPSTLPPPSLPPGTQASSSSDPGPASKKAKASPP